MKWLRALKKIVRKVNRWIAGVGASFLVPLMVLTSADVVGRDLFHHPIPGIIELSEYLLAVSILLGVAYTQQMRGHVAVTALTSRLSSRGRLLLEGVGTVLSLSLFLLLTWEGLVLGLEEMAVSDMLRIPQYPFRLLVAVASFLLSLELALNLGEVARKLRKGESP